jgi:predicted transposase YbfD/YdcC
MEERPFIEKSIKPTDQTIQATLRSTYIYYKNVVDLASSFSQEWTFSNSGGWMLKVYDRKTALFYLIPLNDSLKISLTIRKNEQEAFLRDDELKMLHDKISSSKKYIEGFALQFEIANKNEFQSLELFIRKLIALRA